MWSVTGHSGQCKMDIDTECCGQFDGLLTQIRGGQQCYPVLSGFVYSIRYACAGFESVSGVSQSADQVTSGASCEVQLVS